MKLLNKYISEKLVINKDTKDNESGFINGDPIFRIFIYRDKYILSQKVYYFHDIKNNHIRTVGDGEQYISYFDYEKELKDRGSFPIHLLLEEAHRYVQNDNDVDLLGYNIFERITKEGRKYGTILGFITQRPSELSVTSLSQCSNFVVFRLFYPEDLKIVQGISSNVTEETIERIKKHPLI